MTGEISTIRRFSDRPFCMGVSARLQAVLSSRLTNHQAAHVCEDRNLRNEDMLALGRRDAANIVDDHLPLIVDIAIAPPVHDWRDGYERADGALMVPISGSPHCSVNVLLYSAERVPEPKTS